MQSNKKFDTYMTQDSPWVILHSDHDKTIYSNMLSIIANDLGMQTETLITLLRKSIEGQWPLLLGGKTFSASSLAISAESQILTLKPVDSTEIANQLYRTTGDELFILISSNSKILAMSREASSIFGSASNLGSLFDASSSGAIRSGVEQCLQSGSIPDFLVCHSPEGEGKSNYTISLRKLPSPGKLIYCRLTRPSMAIVTSTIERKSLERVLLEESFCPTFIIDSDGIILSLNGAARTLCVEKWGNEPTGQSFWGFADPDQREALELQHDQRNSGYETASRFTVKLRPSSGGYSFSVDISIVPIPDSNQYVVFTRTRSAISGSVPLLKNETLPTELIKLLSAESMTPKEILEITAGFLGATSAAFVREGEVITVGDSRGLMKILDPIQLAASPCGYRKDGIFIHRIHSGFGVSHLLFLGMPKTPLNQPSMGVLHAASKILGEREAWLALKQVYQMLSTVKNLAESFLQRTEPLEGLLSDLARDSGAETAVIFKISPNGRALKGSGASGVVGRLPDLPLEALNTASWACIRGETAFFAETPDNDLRFSPVFPNSRSELAVPFFLGSTPEGVVLLASTETEAFHYSETELVQLMAILLTSPESSSSISHDQDSRNEINFLKRRVLDYIIHDITALDSTSSIRLQSIEKAKNIDKNLVHNINSLADTTTRLAFFSKWAIWWLKISIYGGTPQQKWIDPIPLLEKVLKESGKISDSKKIELSFYPPDNDIEVCTDGSFVSMIALSLLVCILDFCENCQTVKLSIDQKRDYWSFKFDTTGGNVPAECLSNDRQPEKKNMAFSLAWKLTEELGGTVSTFSSKGKTTTITIRLKVSG